jgi:uncharacterized protein (TIGR04141 family)
MERNVAKKNTFSLYMATSGLSCFDDLLTSVALSKLASGQAYKINSDKFADGSTLYVFPGQPKPPPWAGQLANHFKFKQQLFNQTHSAVLVFQKAPGLFAVTFSRGHVYIDSKKTEAEFGLNVAINFVSEEKLRGIERSNIGVAIRDVAHAAGQKDLRAFGFDDALDLIRKVSGARALTFTKEIEISEVPNVAREAISLFNSQAYKKNAGQAGASEDQRADEGRARRARAQGKQLGRPKKIFDRQKAIEMRRTGASLGAIAEAVGISRSQAFRVTRECGPGRG